MRNGRALIGDVQEFVPAKGAVGIWRLGQMGYALKFGRTAVYVDAFVSEHPRREIAPAFAPEDLSGDAVICGTHDHTDHIDRKAWAALARSNPDARFVVPELLLRRGLAADIGIDEGRLVGVDEGRGCEIDGLRIDALASAHEFLDTDAATGLHPYLGYVFEAGGVTVYHAGDTCKYEGLETKLLKAAPDVMLLPINGRDAARLARGLIGNMTYQEAVDLAGSVAPGLVIPGHFGMFAANSEDPELFMQYLAVKYPGVGAVIPPYCERYVYAVA